MRAPDSDVGDNNAVSDLGAASRAATAAIVIVGALLAGCSSNVSGTAVRAAQTAPADVPPLSESSLDDVLLSVREINGIMDATDIRITLDSDEMLDHSDKVSNPECIGVIYGAEERAYADSGWTAVRDQVAAEPDHDNEHWVEQTAVLFPTAAKAQAFFDKSKRVWKQCSNDAVSVYNDGDAFLWQVHDATVVDEMLTQDSVQEDADGWECQHAMSAVSNLVVEAWACSYDVGDEAVTIATDMIAKAAEN